MSMHSPHLHDDRLLEHYATERTGEPGISAVASHLAVCVDCSGRYTALKEWLDGARSEAIAEADEIFTADRLKRQQHQILRRIEHLGQPARVLSFPGRLGQTFRRGSARVAPRWLAAAAAAGLFVGVAVGGAFFEVGLRHGGLTARRSVQTKTPPNVIVPGASDEDAFLSDLELALERRGAGELEPLDELTPHLRGVSAQLR